MRADANFSVRAPLRAPVVQEIPERLRIVTCKPALREPDIVRLDAELFAELDAAVRREGGVVLRIATREEMPRRFGEYSPMAVDVYRDIRDLHGPSMAEISAITIVDEIAVAAWRACLRPEIDWAGVPAQDIYRFLTHHEIGHRVENMDHFLFARADARPDLGLVQYYNEVLADRYAWKRLYGRKAMPRRAGIKPKRAMDKELAILIEKYPIRRPTRQLSDEPWAMLPASFVQSEEHRHLLGDPTDPFSRGGMLARSLDDGEFFIGRVEDGVLEQMSAYCFGTMEQAATALLWHGGRKKGQQRYWDCFVYRKEGDTCRRVDFHPGKPFANLDAFRAEAS